MLELLMLEILLTLVVKSSLEEIRTFRALLSKKNIGSAVTEVGWRRADVWGLMF